MTKELSYELLPSKNQNLTFNYLENYFNSKNLRFNIVQVKVLRLKNADDQFTNLGYWLSDQFNVASKVVIYVNAKQPEVENLIEINGSILKQYMELNDLINEYNCVRSNFVNKKREEIDDYPKSSIYETLLNAFIHQDYTLQSSLMVKIYEDFIEISNFGGLIKNLKYDDIFVGMSICRNPSLMNFFKFLGLSKGYGTGIKEIREQYRTCFNFPKIRINDDVFKVTLPNKYFSIYDMEDNHLSVFEVGKMLNVFEELSNKQVLSRSEIQKIMDVSSTRCVVILQTLVKREILETVEMPNGSILYRRAR